MISPFFWGGELKDFEGGSLGVGGLRVIQNKVSKNVGGEYLIFFFGGGGKSLPPPPKKKKQACRKP